MGATCCVAARDKTIVAPNTSVGETLHRNNARYPPAWSFRWDNRQRVAGEEGSLSWLSDGISRNGSSDIIYGSAFVSEDVSPLDGFRTQTWQKSPASDQSISRNTSMDVISEQMTLKAKELTGLAAPSFSSHTKSSLPLASQPASPLSSQSHFQPSSSSTPKRTWCSPVNRLCVSKQVSDRRKYGISSTNRYSEFEESQGTPLRNEFSDKSQRGSSDGWSMHAFSELMVLSSRETWYYDNDSFGFNRQKISRYINQTSNEQQTCGACSRLLSEISLWSSQKIIATNDLSVVAVLTCGHVYHGECLEHMTPEIDKYEPACPICTLGEKKTQKLLEKAFKAEMHLKARSNKRVRNRAGNRDLNGGDFGMYDQSVGNEHEGKGPKLGSSSSMKSYAPKPFLMRHFSLGSKTQSPHESHPIRKKGFFWIKSSKI